MLLGKRFMLTRPTTGVQLVDETAKVVSLPANAVVKVLSGPNQYGQLPDKGLVYVLWQERTVALFAVDVEARGIEIKEPDSGHGIHRSAAG